MITIHRRCKCKHCKKLFYPDPRNRTRQKYCSAPECRRASKKASHEKWLQKPENQGHFRGHENVIRVQQWREKHPGYWARAKPLENALQDSLSGNKYKKQTVKLKLNSNALQETIIEQHAVLIGLIAHLTGNALQDSISMTTRRLRELGQDYLEQTHFFKGGSYDQKVSCISGSRSKDSKELQLDRSSFGILSP